MEQLAIRLAHLQAELKRATDKLKFDELAARHDQLQQQMSQPDFWTDASSAQTVAKEQAALAAQIEPWQKLRTEMTEIDELIKLNDTNLEKELDEKLSTLHSQLSTLQKQLRFSGPYDDHNVILSMYAGAGGTDAQDWAQMLLRMYSRWAEKSGLKLKLIDQSPGEEAGLKSAELEISGGPNLYGRLRGEHGVHRLVRLSPFNADHLRQTSFARVEVLPAIEQASEVKLDDKDLKIDVFRSGGAGGQSVNTTDSAVRVTHLPTGLSVAIQNERSQLQNKETALKILRSRLAALQLEQHAKDLADIKGPSQSAEWGNQIRNYVLHPYKQVKDLRSGYETADPQAVLDGDLDPLLAASLEQQ